MKTNSKAQSTNSAPSFEPVAWFYDLLSKVVFGNLLDKSKYHFIDQVKKGDKVLMIGGGSGQELKKITQENMPALIHFVELSPTMIQKAQKELHTMSLPITFLCGTENDIPSLQYDVIITHYFLDLFPIDQLQSIIQKLNQHTHYQSTWLVADFKPTNKTLSIILQSTMYRFFRVLCGVKAKQYPFIEKVLQPYDWQLYQQKTWKDLVYSQVYKKSATNRG